MFCAWVIIIQECIGGGTQGGSVFFLPLLQKNSECSLVIDIICRVNIKEMKDVREVTARRFIGGKTLMLVGRDCVLEDTLHCMTKEGFDPTRPITVKDKNYYCVDVNS